MTDTGDSEVNEVVLEGRSIWECSNQLSGYVSPGTPRELAEFLERESNAAAALAEEIVRLRCVHKEKIDKIDIDANKPDHSSLLAKLEWIAREHDLAVESFQIDASLKRAKEAIDRSRAADVELTKLLPAIITALKNAG